MHRPTSSQATEPSTLIRGVVAYEQRLSDIPRWALMEGSRHFDERSAVHETLQRICKRLAEHGITYAVAGGMALFRHGFRRFTEDVDILITRGDLKRVHDQLTGLGYVPLFTGSKSLRDTESGVRIEFLVTGQFPGDGKVKQLAFPDPSDVAETAEEICYVNLPTLVELKLASGMTGSDRIKDLADVQELIRRVPLEEEFAAQLDPYVRPRYLELWQGVHTARRFLRRCPVDSQTTPPATFDDLIALLPDSADELRRMRDDDVSIEASPGGDYVFLVTTDDDVARKYDMHDEAEFLGGAGDDS